jgi:hypothetical protein
MTETVNLRCGTFGVPDSEPLDFDQGAGAITPVRLTKPVQCSCSCEGSTGEWFYRVAANCNALMCESCAWEWSTRRAEHLEEVMVSKNVTYSVNGKSGLDPSLAKEAAIKPFTDLLDKLVSSPKDRLAMFSAILDKPKPLLCALHDLLDEED